MRAIFLRKPKCAGSSIRKALEKAGAAKVWRPGAKGHLLTQRRVLVLGTANQREFRRRYPKAFEKAFKFAVVRNPADRLVSGMEYLSRGAGVDKKGALRRLLENLPTPETDYDAWHHIVRPQSVSTHDGLGVPIADYLVRFENLEEDFAAVMAALGLGESVKLPHLKKSEREPHGDYYDEETRAAVERIFAEDFRLYGYGFEGGPDVARLPRNLPEPRGV